MLSPSLKRAFNAMATPFSASSLLFSEVCSHSSYSVVVGPIGTKMKETPHRVGHKMQVPRGKETHRDSRYHHRHDHKARRQAFPQSSHQPSHQERSEGESGKLETVPMGIQSPADDHSVGGKCEAQGPEGKRYRPRGFPPSHVASR